MPPALLNSQLSTLEVPTGTHFSLFTAVRDQDRGAVNDNGHEGQVMWTLQHHLHPEPASEHRHPPSPVLETPLLVGLAVVDSNDSFYDPMLLRIATTPDVEFPGVQQCVGLIVEALYTFSGSDMSVQ